MEKLDDPVATDIETRLLAPERLYEVLASVLDRRQERGERRRDRIAELNNGLRKPTCARNASMMPLKVVWPHLMIQSWTPAFRL